MAGVLPASATGAGAVVKTSTMGKVLGAVQSSAPWLMLGNIAKNVRSAAAVAGKVQRGVSKITALGHSLSTGNFSGISGALLAADSVNGKSFGDTTSTDQTKLLQIIAKASESNNKNLSKILINAKSITELSEYNAKILGVGFKSLLDAMSQMNTNLNNVGSLGGQLSGQRSGEDATQGSSGGGFLDTLFKFLIARDIIKLSKNIPNPFKRKPKAKISSTEEVPKTETPKTTTDELTESEKKAKEAEKKADEAKEAEKKADEAKEAEKKATQERKSAERDAKKAKRVADREKTTARRAARRAREWKSSKPPIEHPVSPATEIAKPSGVRGTVARAGRGVANGVKAGAKGAAAAGAFAAVDTVLEHYLFTGDKDDLSKEEFWSDLGINVAIGTGVGVAFTAATAMIGSGVMAPVGVLMMVAAGGYYLYRYVNDEPKIKEYYTKNNTLINAMNASMAHHPWNKVTSKEALKILWIRNDKELELFQRGVWQTGGGIEGQGKGFRNFDNFTSIICEKLISKLTFDEFVCMFAQNYLDIPWTKKLIDDSNHTDWKDLQNRCFIQWLSAFKELYQKMPSGTPLSLMSEIGGINNAKSLTENYAYQLLAANVALHETGDDTTKPNDVVKNNPNVNLRTKKRYQELLSPKNIGYIYSYYQKHPSAYANVIQGPEKYSYHYNGTFGDSYQIHDKEHTVGEEDEFSVNEPEFDNAVALMTKFGSVNGSIMMPSTARQYLNEQVNLDSITPDSDGWWSRNFGSGKSSEQKREEMRNQRTNGFLDDKDEEFRSLYNINPSYDEEGYYSPTRNWSPNDDLQSVTPEETPQPETYPDTTTSTIESVRPSTQPNMANNITVSDPDAIAILAHIDKGITKLANPATPPVPPPNQPIPDGLHVVG